MLNDLRGLRLWHFAVGGALLLIISLYQVYGVVGEQWDRKAFHDNRERLRTARLAREAATGPILYPAPGLPDATPIGNVRFFTRITNALNAAGVKTVGEIRQASDVTLLSFQDLVSAKLERLSNRSKPQRP